MRLLACLALTAALACLGAAESPALPPVVPVQTQPAAPATAPAPLFTDQEWSATQKVAQPAAQPGTATAVSLFIGLLVVIGLAVGLGWLVKRLNPRRLLGGKGRHLEVLETVTVGPKRQLALVRCGGHWLVVGMGEREMIAVATLPAPASAEPAGAAVAPAPVAPAPPAASPFANELGRLLGGRQP